MGKYHPFGSPPRTILVKGPKGSWDQKKVHTLSVVELNLGGYRFWGYYTGYDRINIRRNMGLVRSNDLENWIKFEGNPVVRNLRWGTCVLINGVIHMFGTRDYSDSNGGSFIVRLTSKDGVNFIEQETVVNKIEEQNNQNPFIFYDEPNKMYRLYWFNDKPHEKGHLDYIKEKHSDDISFLASSQTKTVLLSEHSILAAPSVAFFQGKYWLTAETLICDVWVTVCFVSNDPIAGFKPVENFVILMDNTACYFQYIFDNQLNGFYSHRVSVEDCDWNIGRVFHNLADSPG